MTAQDGLEPFTHGDLQRAYFDELTKLELAHRKNLEDRREWNKKRKAAERDMKEATREYNAAFDRSEESRVAYELLVLEEKIPDYIRQALREKKRSQERK